MNILKNSEQPAWLILWNEKHLTGAIFSVEIFSSLIKLQSEFIPATQVCLL